MVKEDGMEANVVLPLVESSSEKAVRFLLEGKQLVPNDFHVTEVKRLSVESLDCGGGESAWRELVVQLWSPKGNNSQTAMTAGKFLSILRRAEALNELDGNSLRFEYGDTGKPAVQYYVDHIASEGGTLDVHLTPPHVTCKPHERTRSAELSVVQAGACCAPGSAEVCCG